MEQKYSTVSLLRLEGSDTVVEFSVAPIKQAIFYDSRQQSIYKEIESIDEALSKSQKVIDQLNVDIDRLTNHADGFDNIIAVSSGILSGLIDSFFVGELNLYDAKADAHKHVNKFIEKYAKKRGYKGSNGLRGAITYLEGKFPVEQDNVWKGKGISSAALHHLDDFAHHPTPLGIVSAILVKFFRTGIFVNRNGEWHFVLVDTSPTQLLKIWLPVIVSGILSWLVHVAESKYIDKMDKEIPKPIQKLLKMLAQAPAVIEVLKIIVNWFGHSVSDMGGSKNTPGGGMGISGTFLSILKEFSSLPIIKDTNLPQIVSDLYSEDKFDMRAEIAVIESLGKQAVPVLINECIVRTFYFVRYLITEKQQHAEWKDVNWQNVLPWGNRTINRMLTISSGTFVAADMADAAVRSAMKSGGEPSMFLANMVLRVNFVGIGRFAIALGTDSIMGYKREKKRDERIKLQTQMLYLSSAKLFYKQADMWIEAKDAEQTINNMEKVAYVAIDFYIKTMEEISDNLINISAYKPGIEQNNPTLLEDIQNTLKF